MTDELLSLVPCERRTKTKKCDCAPCQARIRYWGMNLSCAQQERLRMGETLKFIDGSTWTLQAAIDLRDWKKQPMNPQYGERL